MTPAERLLKAADLLDKRASAATEGPWAEPYEGEGDSADDPGWWVHNGKVGMKEYAVTVTLPYSPKAEPDARYIATMHPEVGKAVAAWLRTLGEDAKWLTGTGREFGLRIADLLLAGDS